MMNKTSRHSRSRNSVLVPADDNASCKMADQDFSAIDRQQVALATMLRDHQSLSTVLQAWHRYVAAECEQIRLMSLPQPE